MAMTTSKSVYRAGHAPLPSGVHVAPFPDPFADDQDAATADALAGLDKLLATMSAPSETAGMIIEPVLGEGGYVPAPAAFLQGIAERCREHGILFIADEVQSGFGRSGRMFAIEHAGIEPDVICMAKGIASGMPFAALGTRRELDDRWPTGSHGGTYGGNPVSCAAALATIDVLTADGFLADVRARGAQLVEGLERLQKSDGLIRQVRSLGLLVAVDYHSAAVAGAVRSQCLDEHHVILMGAGYAGTALRFMPPLTVSADEIDLALDALAAAHESVAST
jgi:4-aminobutyrate aminotransferase-like enzyme